MTTPPKPLLLPTDVLGDQRLESPEGDLFTARAIAGRVAELLAGSRYPVHVGVFGAWGAGKSSFLRLVESELDTLAGRAIDEVQYPKKFEVVRYDAWRYGGQALRRDLIAVASRKLKVHRRRYTDGLFESRQVVRLEVNELLRRIMAFLSGVLALAGSLAFIGSILWGIVWVLSRFTGLDSPNEILQDLSVPWGKVTAVVTGTLAVLNAPSLLGVSVNRSLPSQDDEFARNLRELIREAELPFYLRSLSRVPKVGAWLREKFDRKVIFFIDELDRATDREVLDTLTALQTQFASARVSVVVAADRDVLEKALDDEHRQEGPEREWDPYLSSSDAFLDKVFQHTFTLPPLRSERIATFARDLVGNQPGLWKNINDIGLLDHVLYALLPSHVVSPRRIKVLLNAYATQTRVAQARELPVETMRGELAVWTVLQLEFPAFASDLRIDPRLRTALTAGQPAEGKRARMIARHRRVDPPATEGESPEWMAWTKREQLAEYLERTSHIPELPFDLLFLEVAGSAIGFFAQEVAEVLDRSDEAPAEDTLRLLSGIDDNTRTRAIRHLAEYSRRAISVGRDKVITALAGLVETHGPDTIEYSDAVLEAFRPYPSGQIPDAALPGYFRTVLQAAPDDITSIAVEAGSRSAFANSALFAERVSVPTELSEDARSALVAWWCDDLTCQLLRVLIDKDVQWLLDDLAEKFPAAVVATLTTALASPNADVDDSDDSEDVEVADEPPVADDDAEEADGAADDGSNDPDWLPEDVIKRFLRQLSAAALAEVAASAGHLARNTGESPLLAELLVETRVPTDPCLCALAAVVVASDTDCDVGTWVHLAAACEDQGTVRAAVDTLAGRLEVSSDQDRASALELIASLAPVAETSYVLDAVAGCLAGSQWDADPTGRSVLGTEVLEALADLDSDRVSDLVFGEAVAGLPYLRAATLSPSDLLAALDLMDGDAQAQLDALLKDEAAAVSESARLLTARMRLHRLSAHRFTRIQAKAVGRTVALLKGDEPGISAARDSLVAEFFAKPRTEKEVETVLGLGGWVYWRHVRTWMAQSTPGPATRIWIRLASGNYKDSSIQDLTRARSLDAGQLADYLGGLAASADLSKRARAVTLVRMFDTDRPEISRAAEAVAVAINRKSSEETKQAVRLLTDYEPWPLSDEAVAVMLGAPGYAVARKLDKELRKRLK